MSFSPAAERILAHLRTVESARVRELRRITRLDTAGTNAAALELCRAGLCVSEWNGVRYRLRERARTSICPPDTTTARTTQLADDTHAHQMSPCGGGLGALAHTGATA